MRAQQFDQKGEKKMKFRTILAFFLAFALILSACAQTTPAPQQEQPPAEEAEPPVIIEEAEPPAEEIEPPVIEEAEPPAEKELIEITVWSHWADQPSKIKVVEQVMQDYMAENSNVTIRVEWWQKSDLWLAMQNAFSVGEGGPDFFYFDRDSEQGFTYVDAGWIAPLDDVVDWDQMLPAAKTAATWENVKGETHTWFAVLEAAPTLLLYNPDIFAELGIEVPENHQFTTAEFYDVAMKCNEGGYDVISTGVGDRKYVGQYMYKLALISKLGMEEYIKVWNGERSWQDPEVQDALQWIQSVIEIPAMPDTYSTMTLAESHQYFHTLQKACMFPIGAWYTGRTFQPPEQGGQPADFRNGFLKYPAFPDGEGTNHGYWAAGGGMGLWAHSPNLDVAKDIMNFFMQEKYGNMWLAETAIPSGIKTDPSAISEDHPYFWYFGLYDEAYADYDWRVETVSPCPDLYTAYEAYITDGLAARLMTLEEATEAIEAARALCQ
jgi:multiple sugar transport system substrate-binding protein